VELQTPTAVGSENIDIAIRAAWPIGDENRAEPVASHSSRRFCGRRFVGLGFGFFVFILFPGNGGVVFEPVTPTGKASFYAASVECLAIRSLSGRRAPFGCYFAV
jgi:hypothetical protein